MKPSTTAERLQEAMNIRGLKQVDVLRLAEPYCRAYGVNRILRQSWKNRFDPICFRENRSSAR